MLLCDGTVVATHAHPRAIVGEEVGRQVRLVRAPGETAGLGGVSVIVRPLGGLLRGEGEATNDLGGGEEIHRRCGGQDAGGEQTEPDWMRHRTPSAAER